MAHYDDLDTWLAIRWCWTARVFSNEWFGVDALPTVAGDQVAVKLRSAKRAVEVTLSLDDASAIGESER